MSLSSFPPLSLLEHSPDVFARLDGQGQLQECNRAGRSFFAEEERLPEVIPFLAGELPPGPLRVQRAGQTWEVWLSAQADQCWMQARACPEVVTQAAYRSVAEGCPLSFVRYDRQGRIVYVNQKLRDFLGVTDLAQLVGRHPSEIWNDGRFHDITLATERAIAEGLSTRVEFEEPMEGGFVRYHSVLVVPEREDLGEISGALAFGQDFTQLRRAERLSQERDWSLQTLMENVPVCLAQFREDLICLYVSPAVTTLFEKPHSFFEGHSLEQFCWGGAEFAQQVRAVFADGEQRQLLTYWNTPQGERTFEVVLVPERREHGRVATVLTIARDVTDELKAQRELRLLSQAVNQSNDAIYLINSQGGFDYVNDLACRTLGYSAEELTELGVLDIDPSLSVRAVLDSVRSQAPGRFETFHQTRAGLLFPVEITTSQVLSGEEGFCLAIARDITNRKRRESELRRVLWHARGAVWRGQVSAPPGWENSSAEWLASRQSWEVVFDNEEQTQLIFPLKVEPEGTYGQAWMRAILPEDGQRLALKVAQALLGKESSYQGEFRSRDQHGQIHWFSQTSDFEPLENGLWRVTSITRDITERKLLEEQFLQSQKLEALGQLAGGVAHDFNNILTAVLMQLELLRVEPDLSSEVRQGLEEMGESAERAAKLVRQLLLFSRKPVLQLGPCDLNPLLENLLCLLRRLLREDIELRFQPGPSPLTVEADVGLLEQVVVNLVVNARDAMPRGGLLCLETCFQEPHWAVLRVRDHGTGIPPEILPRIFEPFFTTKEVGKGSGLGLASALGIVEQHQGQITASSSLEEGTVFEIRLPISSAVATSVPAAPPRQLPQGGGECILLVEDEVLVRATLGKILERSGYQILMAETGPEAERILERPGPPIHLLLTDLVLPGGLSGQQLAYRVRQRRPKQKILFMSGYSPETADLHEPILEGITLLSKPIEFDTLLHTVRSALEPQASFD